MKKSRTRRLHLYSKKYKNLQKGWQEAARKRKRAQRARKNKEENLKKEEQLQKELREVPMGTRYTLRKGKVHFKS